MQRDYNRIVIDTVLNSTVYDDEQKSIIINATKLSKRQSKSALYRIYKEYFIVTNDKLIDENHWTINEYYFIEQCQSNIGLHATCKIIDNAKRNAFK